MANDETPTKIQRMMNNMGYEKGKGLGKSNQGITEPVAAGTMQNRQGIGLIKLHEPIEKPDTVWVEGMDVASETGDIVATLEGKRAFLDNNDLTTNTTIGERITNIDRETKYCDPRLLSEMLKCKKMLDQHSVLIDGRARSNPYEKIAGGIFLNRAAMKMANLDYVTEFVFTKTDDDETLYFADICAGPGGFTEYMLWRRPMQSVGFGFTLKECNDFKLRDIVCGPVECFHPSYGKNDDGDIMNEDNLLKFQQEVMNSTGGLGVHTVTADGGFSVEGQENIQEILSKQLYLCQFICGINILRTGGNFVCKLFDTFTDFTVGLIYIVSTLFSQVSIVKPITSRPANSERYIIFQDFINSPGQVESIRRYLCSINARLTQMKEENKDVIKIVSDKILKNDTSFKEFMSEINNKVLEQQIIALAKLHAFIVDRNLVDDRQCDIRDNALKLWNVPDQGRDIHKGFAVPSGVDRLVNVNYRHQFEGLKAPCKKPISQLKEADFVRSKFVVKNHLAGFVGQPTDDLKESIYVISKDKKYVNYYSGSLNRRPDRLTEYLKKWPLSIPSFTIMLVHFGTEFSGEKGNIKHKSLVIVDACMIYGEDISQSSYSDRMDKVHHMCTLIDPKQRGFIRPLEVFPLQDMYRYLGEKMCTKRAKGVQEQKMISVTANNHFFPPGKLLIIDVVKNPWMIATSKSGGYTYYYNVESQASVKDTPDSLYGSYSECRIHEVEWSHETQDLHHDAFLKILRNKIASAN